MSFLNPDCGKIGDYLGGFLSVVFTVTPFYVFPHIVRQKHPWIGAKGAIKESPFRMQFSSKY
jgi:hypothetical protein